MMSNPDLNIKDLKLVKAGEVFELDITGNEFLASLFESNALANQWQLLAMTIR